MEVEVKCCHSIMSYIAIQGGYIGKGVKYESKINTIEEAIKRMGLAGVTINNNWMFFSGSLS